MEFPRAYAQERENSRTYESERKVYYWLRDFFINIQRVVTSGVSTWLFGKSTVYGTDPWQFDGSIQISDNGAGNAPYLNLVKTNGTSSAPTATASGETLGYVVGTGYNGTTFYAGATVEFHATETFGTGSGTKIVFKTTPTGGHAFQESGYITAAGSWAAGLPSLATNATVGFLYVPYTDGLPTGSPETIAGKYPIVIGKSGSTKQPYYHNGTAWVAVGSTASGSSSTFDPAPAANVGAFTTVTGSGIYTQVGNLVVFSAIITMTDIGTASGAWYITLPSTSSSSSAATGFGRQSSSGKMQQGYGAVSSNTLTIANYDNTFSAANGATVYITGSYQI